MASTGSERAALQKLAYAKLSKFFQEHEHEAAEIEILPPAIQPPDGISMQDGSNLGVPKKILALAFMEAREHFFEVKDATTSLTALQATKIMLLFDPEYLTAANYRKRRLLLLETSSPHHGSLYHNALRQELCFLDSILTSPLHRQSKSPTLWSHRTWILDPLIRLEWEQASEEQKTAFWQSELRAVCKSGEQHPKNYYAWQYARRLFARINCAEVDLEAAQRVKDWCCRHPSDISGWSFLFFLLLRLEPAPKRQDLLIDVLNYTLDLRSEHESLWVFIRTALAQDTQSTNGAECYQMLQNAFDTTQKFEGKHAFSERMSSALAWVNHYGESAARSGKSGSIAT